jgi:hypothetical protein
VFASTARPTLDRPGRRRRPIPPPTFAVKATAAEIAEGAGSLPVLHALPQPRPTREERRDPGSPRANEATHATFEQIVRRRRRRTLGMPSFAKDISSDQVRMIQAYVLGQARQASA